MVGLASVAGVTNVWQKQQQQQLCFWMEHWTETIFGYANNTSELGLPKHFPQRMIHVFIVTICNPPV